MTHVDPIRLIDDPNVSAQLQRDLHIAREVPSGYATAAGFEKLQQQLLKTTTELPVSPSGGGWGIVGLVSALGLGITFLGMTGEPPAKSVTPSAIELPVSQPQAPLRQPLASPTPVPSQLPTVGAEPTPPRDEIVAAAEPTRVAVSRKRKRPKAHATPSAAPPSSDEAPDNRYLREVRQLNRARTELGNDPTKAFELAEAGRVEFASGPLAQEWEGVAILALVKLGRHNQAKTRAKRFLARYPKGTFSAKVRAATM